MRSRRFVLVASAVLASLALAATPAFAQDSEEAEETDSATGTTVNVQVQEWAVIPDTLSASAGSVTFDVENVGPEDLHEFVVVRTDLPASDLPTAEDGAFDEEAEGVQVLGELEDIEVGATDSLTLDLEPGHYVLLCNLVQEEDDGTVESHYRMGMWIDFEVAAATGTTVNVQVQEWAVIPDTLSASAGSVTFDVENVGPEDLHEFVVVRTDLPASDLPTAEDGAFDEEAEGVQVLGELEDIEVGATDSLTLDLEPGHYVLLCNLVQEEDDGTVESHYRMGMWIDFEVTA